MNIFQDNQSYFNPFLDQCPFKEESLDLFDPQEAFMLGNLFKNLYMSYKGFSNYCLQPMNQRQIALLNVQIYGFAAHEINLFLDMYPNNKQMIKLYQEYRNKTNEAIIQYEKEFGPLTVSNSSSQTPFEWVQGPWPWQQQL